MEREKRQKGIDLCKLLEKNKKPSHPTSDMYAEEKGKHQKRRFYPQLFYWNHCWLLLQMEIGGIVNKEAAEQNTFTWQNRLLWITCTLTESDARPYMQEQRNSGGGRKLCVTITKAQASLWTKDLTGDPAALQVPRWVEPRCTLFSYTELSAGSNMTLLFESIW